MATRARRKKEEENTSFVKNVEFRANRGNKIKALLDKKENESDSDDFWKNNKYFGNFDDVMNESEESEDYSQEADVPDEFDEDFGEESDEESEGGEEEDSKTKVAPKTLSIQISKSAQKEVKKFIEKDEKKKVKPAIAVLRKSQNKAKAKAAQAAQAKAKAKAQAEAEAQAKAEAEAQAQAQEKAKAEAQSKAQGKTSASKTKPQQGNMEIETPVHTTPAQSLRPRRELRSVTFAMDTPEKQSVEKAQKVEKPETPQKDAVSVTFVVKAQGKKNKERKVTVQAILPKKPSLKKKPGSRTPPKKQPEQKVVVKTQMEIEPETKPQGRTTRGQDKRVILEKAAVNDNGTMKAPKVKLKPRPTKNAKTQAKTAVQAEAEVPKKKGRYIHDFYTQEELMKEAALTEIYNKKSLESLLQLETEKKDSNMYVRRFEMDEPSVTFSSKKVNDKEETKIILSNKEAYQTYFDLILNPPSTSLKKRPYKFDEFEDSEEKDTAEVKTKKLFLTNAQYKISEISKDIQKMEEEENRITKTIRVLKGILEKKQEALEM